MSTNSVFVDRFSDYYRTTPRSRLRHAVVSSLATLQLISGQQAYALKRNRIHILCLHSVFCDEEMGFRELLNELSKHHVFIPYTEAVERLRSGRIDKPYITFSFDDGMKNNLRAAKILDEFSAKACFFVCTDIVGETNADRLQSFCRERLHSPVVEFLSWDDIESLLRSGHEIGSHTRTHQKLTALDKEKAWLEIEGSRADLSKRIGAVAHFAWPYGRFSDAPLSIGRIVEQCGYQSCASTERGCHVVAAGDMPEALCLRRDHLMASWPVAHSNYFIAKSAGRATDVENRWPRQNQGRGYFNEQYDEHFFVRQSRQHTDRGL